MCHGRTPALALGVSSCVERPAEVRPQGFAALAATFAARAGALRRWLARAGIRIDLHESDRTDAQTLARLVWQRSSRTHCCCCYTYAHAQVLVAARSRSL